MENQTTPTEMFAARAKASAATLLTSVRWHWLANYPSWDSDLLAWRCKYDVNCSFSGKPCGCVEVAA